MVVFRRQLGMNRQLRIGGITNGELTITNGELGINNYEWRIKQLRITNETITNWRINNYEWRITKFLEVLKKFVIHN